MNIGFALSKIIYLLIIGVLKMYCQSVNVQKRYVFNDNDNTKHDERVEYIQFIRMYTSLYNTSISRVMRY